MMQRLLPTLTEKIRFSFTAPCRHEQLEPLEMESEGETVSPVGEGEEKNLEFGTILAVHCTELYKL